MEIIGYKFRLTAISEVFNSISEFRNWLYISFNQPMSSQFKTAATIEPNFQELTEKINNIYCIHNKYRIYLSDDLSSKIDHLTNTINKELTNFHECYNENGWTDIRNEMQMIYETVSFINSDGVHNEIDEITGLIKSHLTVFSKK